MKTLDTVDSGQAARRGWVLPAALAGGAGLALALILGLLLAGRSDEEKPDPLVALESEAEEFYRRRLEDAMAGKDEEVDGAIRAAAGKYDETRFGLKIRELRDTVAARIKEKRDRELAEQQAAHAAEEEKRKRAAFDAALREAEKAEKARDLEGAARHLKAALAERKDPKVSARLAELEARLAKVERLLAEAERHERAEEWAEARAKYEEALKDASPAKHKLASARLVEVRERLAGEEVVANARRHADAGRWREAWAAVERARKDGVDGAKALARLDEVARRAAKALAPPKELTGPLGVEFVLVPGGTFAMGTRTIISVSGDAGLLSEAEREARRNRAERPAHQVAVSTFYAGRHEVMRAEFDAFRRKARRAPKAAGEGRTPAASMSWEDAKRFCAYLKSVDPAGAVYRLPTEAEWEFAARGPEGREYPWGKDAPGTRRASLAGDADGFAGIAPVGSFPSGATPLGVHDLAGNVAEWCSDWYGPYDAAAQRDPKGPPAGKARVVRGGAHVFDASYARCSARAGRRPANPSECIGFRVVRELTEDETRFLELSGKK